MCASVVMGFSRKNFPKKCQYMSGVVMILEAWVSCGMVLVLKLKAFPVLCRLGACLSYKLSTLMKTFQVFLVILGENFSSSPNGLKSHLKAFFFN